MPHVPDYILQKLNEATVLQADGQFSLAAELLEATLTSTSIKEPVLRALVQLNIVMKDVSKAEHYLKELIALGNNAAFYTKNLANLYLGNNQQRGAIALLSDFTRVNPDIADGYFNLATCYQKARLFNDALINYKKAIELNFIDSIQAKLNLADVLQQLRREDEAFQVFEKLLDLEPECIPALYNLAGLCEEMGQKDKAIALYLKIRAIDEGHAMALSRLAYISDSTDNSQKLTAQIKVVLTRWQYSNEETESLYFALGKLYDDCKDYQEAALFYAEANRLSEQRIPPYNREYQVSVTEQMSRVFDASWMQDRSVNSAPEFRPVFICGMFRSGSTLLEQILSAHPEIQSAGEIDFLNRQILQLYPDFPFDMHTAESSSQSLRTLAASYINEVKEILGKVGTFTDKNPKNFMYVGLIKKVFPQAKFIFTQREPLDNSLSIYFQQLDETLNYAANIKDIRHYLSQHDRLLRHWKTVLEPSDYMVVNYEELITDNKNVIAALLSFCNLNWNEQCLAFYKQKTRVKTASIWQVRQALHNKSISRWSNYAPFIQI